MTGIIKHHVELFRGESPILQGQTGIALKQQEQIVSILQLYSEISEQPKRETIEWTDF